MEVWGGGGGEAPILDFFFVLQLQASHLPCTLPPLGLAPRALAGREPTFYLTMA